MDVKYINPFLVAVQNVFDTMLSLPFKLGKAHIKDDPLPLYEVSGIIGLSGDVTGSVVISLSRQIACQLASALSGENLTELNDDCIDAIGEITNMIAGNAKKDFPGDHNSLSIPNVVIGRHKVAYPKGTPIIALPCETSAGRLAIDIALKPAAVPAQV